MRPIFTLILGAILLLISQALSLFGLFRSVDWLRLNSPATFSLLDKPGFQETLLIAGFGMCAFGLYEALKSKNSQESGGNLEIPPSTVSLGASDLRRPHLFLEFQAVDTYKVPFQDRTEFIAVNTSEDDAFGVTLRIPLGKYILRSTPPINIAKGDRQRLPYSLVDEKGFGNVTFKGALLELLDELAKESSEGLFSTSISLSYQGRDGGRYEQPLLFTHYLGASGTPFIEIRPPEGPALLSSDQKTLEALQKLLPNEGGIMQLRGQLFWGRFPWDADAVLFSFLQRDIGPDHGFLDQNLEELRQQLHEAIKLLLDRVHRYSDPPSEISDTASGKFRFFLKLDGEHLAIYDARRNEVFEAAKAVCEIYDDLVLTARRKFEI